MIKSEITEGSIRNDALGERKFKRYNIEQLKASVQVDQPAGGFLAFMQRQ